jgi:hypothetical protein
LTAKPDPNDVDAVVWLAGEAYIKSRQHEGWVCVPEHYDDGGFTGANMDRPAIRRLLADIEAGKVDCVVVYKVEVDTDYELAESCPGDPGRDPVSAGGNELSKRCQRTGLAADCGGDGLAEAEGNVALRHSGVTSVHANVASRVVHRAVVLVH